MGVARVEKKTEQLRRLLPEIDLIRDRDLRRKTVETWLTAWSKGSYSRLEDAGFTARVRNYRLIDHVRAVTQIALQMAKVIRDIYRVRINLDRLIAACLLHDVDKLMIYKESRRGVYVKTDAAKIFPHGFLGAYLAWKIGVPEDVVHMIATHSPDSPSPGYTIEDIVATYADLAPADCIFLLSKSKLLLERIKNR